MAQIDITRERSLFWLRIYDNYDDDKGYSFLTNDIIYEVIDIKFPELEEMSPKGWTKSSGGNMLLWIPQNRVDIDTISSFISWAEQANTHIWLGKNRNIEPYFDGALDYCIAADWNYDFTNAKRTLVGEAEYQIKYCLPRGEISEEDAEKQAEILLNALLDCMDFLPIRRTKNLLITTIPALVEDQKKLSWLMAQFIQEKYGGEFLTATLKKLKPKTKSLSVQEKVDIWKKIYSNDDIDFSDDVKGKKVLIIDDLYQSGASIWAYAEYLKSIGAKKVYGLVSVKSQRDSDNQ